jgi:hypothetical protein
MRTSAYPRTALRQRQPLSVVILWRPALRSPEKRSDRHVVEHAAENRQYAPRSSSKGLSQPATTSQAPLLSPLLSLCSRPCFLCFFKFALCSLHTGRQGGRERAAGKQRGGARDWTLVSARGVSDWWFARSLRVRLGRAECAPCVHRAIVAPAVCSTAPRGGAYRRHGGRAEDHRRRLGHNAVLPGPFAAGRA